MIQRAERTRTKFKGPLHKQKKGGTASIILDDSGGEGCKETNNRRTDGTQSPVVITWREGETKDQEG